MARTQPPTTVEARRRISPLLWALAAGAVCTVAAPEARAQGGGGYHKTFYVEGVAPNAQIKGGGITQTWATVGGIRIFSDSHEIRRLQSVWGFYEHAAPDPTDRDLIGGTLGFPINNNLVGNVDDVGAVPGGWHPARITSTDNHGNEAWAEVDVDKRQVYGPTVRLRNGTLHALSNSVEVEIQGSVSRGALPHLDPPEAHSADSFAAVEIAGSKIWRETEPGARPTVRAYNRAVMYGGRYEQQLNNQGRPRRPRGQTRDPVFATLHDLDTGISITEEIMGLNVAWENATYNLNDDFLSLTIKEDSDESFVELEFSNESDWVLEQYHYSAYLDSDGLVLDGLMPDLSQWLMTTDGDLTTWTVELGGEPMFDMAEIRVPDELITAGHDYVLDVGEGDGIYEVGQIVPAPGGIALLALGGCASLRRRRS